MLKSFTLIILIIAVKSAGIIKVDFTHVGSGLNRLLSIRFDLRCRGAYCMPKKSWPIFYGKLLYKIGQDFWDIQYHMHYKLNCIGRQDA